MPKFALFLAGLAIFAALGSCEKEPLKINPQVPECIGEPDIHFPTGCEDNPAVFDSTAYCELRPAGSYAMSEVSKTYLPQFCLEVGDYLTFANGRGDSLHFELTFKSYHNTLHAFAVPLSCEEDSLNPVWYCIESERIIIRLSAPEMELTIEIRIIPDRSTAEIGQVGELLRITREYRTSYGLFKTERWEVILYPRSLSYRKTEGQIFFSTKEIGRVVYENVITRNTPGTNYFYNREFGLIGFYTGQNFWKRVE